MTLQARLTGLAVEGRIAIAYSGGLDSRFLAHVAARAGLKPLLLHAIGPHMASSESDFARRWAMARAMDLQCLEVDPLTVAEVAANDRMRCYHCKRALFIRLKQEAGSLPCAMARRPAILKPTGPEQPRFGNWKSFLRLPWRG